MPARYDDAARTLTLSVRDLVAVFVARPQGGGSSGPARLAAGQRAHVDWAQEMAAEASPAWRAEWAVKKELSVSGWTVVLGGRVDGAERTAERWVVEEVKSTLLDAGSLYGTVAVDLPDAVAQLEVYLWMLAEPEDALPVGRLVLVSIVDGSQHVLGLSLDPARVEARIIQVLGWLIRARERQQAWLDARGQHAVPLPHQTWREGQQYLAAEIEAGLDAGHPVLAEAPTGLGKTDAALHAVLRHAIRNRRQVFWATARTTHQAAPFAAAARLAVAGRALRIVQLVARGKTCAKQPACDPGRCPLRQDFRERLEDSGILERYPEGLMDGAGVDALAGRHDLCPFELSIALAREADVVVGDLNYVLDPSIALSRLLDVPRDWLVVADEAHQLVERARGWLSPSFGVRTAKRAAAALRPHGAAAAPLVALAVRAAAFVETHAHHPPLRSTATEAQVLVFADEIEALATAFAGAGHAHLLFQAGRADDGEGDPFAELAFSVGRFATALAAPPGEGVVIARTVPGEETLCRVCLDPSGVMGPAIAAFGGFVALSATLSPPAFYRDLLGLSSEVHGITIPSPFPPENRRVIVAPRISTAFADRQRHAAPLASLLSQALAAVPGNVAVYFPSFAMLQDIVGRITPTSRERLVQSGEMDDAARDAVIAAMAAPGPHHKVLFAVLGGVFAESIDLPAGVLDAVIVVGPALPPVGLERDLLREGYEQRFGAGFLYSSLVPGLTRVIQAAGRLVRRPEDRGAVVLVDRRFRWRDVVALLPPDWIQPIPLDPIEELRRFFDTRTGRREADGEPLG